MTKGALFVGLAETSQRKVSGRPIYFGYNDFTNDTGGRWVRREVVGRRHEEFTPFLERFDGGGSYEVAVIYDTTNGEQGRHDTGVLINNLEVSLFRRPSPYPVPTAVPEKSIKLSSLYLPLASHRPADMETRVPRPITPYLFVENVTFERSTTPATAHVSIKNGGDLPYQARQLTIQSSDRAWYCVADDFELGPGQYSKLSTDGLTVSWPGTRFQCTGTVSLDPGYAELGVRDRAGEYVDRYCWDLDGRFPCWFE